jgi:hypothetical protein
LTYQQFFGHGKAAIDPPGEGNGIAQTLILQGFFIADVS